MPINQLGACLVLVLLSLRENPGELGSQVFSLKTGMCEQGTCGEPSEPCTESDLNDL